MANDLIAVALPTGRLFPEAVDLFMALGSTEVEALRDSRRLTVEDRASGLKFLALKPVDIPVYVEHGAADMGIVGKDLLLEQGRDVYEPLDLGFGACRLVVAEPASLRKPGCPQAWSCLRVATKYPKLAERHFSQKGIQVEIVHLSGSIELAPVMGLAEWIVDLVDTGRTLRENDLVEVEEVFKASARLIVNRASLKTRYQAIQKVIEALRRRVLARGGGTR
jgi:ATP phosphoribosyltransferase